MSMYPYKPDRIYRVKAWTIKIFDDEGIALCHRPKNINVVVTKDAYHITRLPKYVIKFLWDIGFLHMWKDAQLEKSALRLREIRMRYENSINRKEVI